MVGKKAAREQPPERKTLIYSVERRMVLFPPIYTQVKYKKKLPIMHSLYTSSWKKGSAELRRKKVSFGFRVSHPSPSSFFSLGSEASFGCFALTWFKTKEAP